MLKILLAVVLLVSAPGSPAAYRAAVEKYRADRVAELTAPNGWLAVRGLFWLHERANAAGSDASSVIQTETYGAGRFLHTPLPSGGFVDLDFNRAYNPPCAFTEFAPCPLPVKENQLQINIKAGELMYKH